jgi:integrase
VAAVRLVTPSEHPFVSPQQRASKKVSVGKRISNLFERAAARTGVESPHPALVPLTSNARMVKNRAAKRKPNCQESSERKSPPFVIKSSKCPPIKIYSGQARGYLSFTVAYYSGGKRKRESFANFDNAKERAYEVQRAIINDRLAVLELTSVDRDGYLGAMNLLRPLGVPLYSAVEEYVAARSLLNGEPLLSAVQEHLGRRRNILEKRVREVVDELIASKIQVGLSKRYTDTLRCYLNRFASAFETNIGSVISRMIEDWLAAQKLSPRGRNNIRQSIVTLFHFARSRHYLQKGQPTEADDVPKVKERGGKIGILTPTELALLMKKAPADARLYFALGAFTGMRASEILRLEWSEVNFERGHITVAADKAKTATRRLVPIQPNLMQWLSPHRGRSGSPFKSRRDVARAIAFAKSNKVDWPTNALRHSYATYRLAAIADTARVALEMGNSPQKLMTNYRELADEHDAAAWFSIAPKRPANVRCFDIRATA